MSNPLQDIAYEDITDVYALGKYGDFNVIINKENGYINVTKLCSEGGRMFKNWIRLDSSKELIKIVDEDILLAHNRASTSIEMIKSSEKNEIRGTYAHPKLVPHIASWVSPKFAIKVSDIVNNYFNRKQRLEHEKQLEKMKKNNTILKKNVNIIKKKKESLEVKFDNYRKEAEIRHEESMKLLREQIKKQDETINKLNKAKKKINNMNIKLDDANEQLTEVKEHAEVIKELNRDISRKLDIAVEDRVPKAKSKKKEEQFVLLKVRNDREEDYEHKYYVICGQKQHARNRTKKLCDEEHGFVKVFELQYTPNTKNLYHRFKEELGDDIDYSGNSFSVENMNTHEIMETIIKINDDKKNI